ncbi:hypothetical protein Tsubulata_042530 [Turnera subulata]|uniref:Serine-threonine/tyrosine-protein kinase catalytic domain-containing protein n=1 Tax=Turnera subulata TaxID=218843 RepID=A0A9Q0JL65_9ROSI|nr:hypothetical protein Tsubulata_042530 [Turnera subulata]
MQNECSLQFGLSQQTTDSHSLSPDRHSSEAEQTGTLKNGQEVAVKRLFKNSRQKINEFKNEVKHIVKLQHRNLVKLVGCCIEAVEEMLVYVFKPNKSLDFFIFDVGGLSSVTGVEEACAVDTNKKRRRD